MGILAPFERCSRIAFGVLDINPRGFNRRGLVDFLAANVYKDRHIRKAPTNDARGFGRCRFELG